MFYLQLEALEETVIDCLIQQNVMTVTIETKFDLESLIEPLVPALKENLKEPGLQLVRRLSKKTGKHEGSLRFWSPVLNKLQRAQWM